MKFSRPIGCLKYRNRVGDVICGVTSRRNVMIEIEGLEVGQCIRSLRFCDVVGKAAEIFAVLINRYFAQNQIEDKGYLMSLTSNNVHIISLTKLTNMQAMEVIQMLINTLNELENTELKDVVNLFDRKYLQMCLNRKACTLRYSMKGEKEPPEPLAVIRPGELEMNYRYRFLWSVVEPLARNVIIKGRKFFVWP